MDNPTIDVANDLLPEEIEAQLEKLKQLKLERIEAIGQVIAKKRDTAVAARTASGIEEEWATAQDAYDGIDDANRGEEGGTRRELKPATAGGSFVGARETRKTKSTVLLNITRPYTDAAAARVGDMLMPTDDRNWGFKPTPVPEMDKKKADATPVPMLSVPVVPASPENPNPPKRPGTVADLIAKAYADARTKADVAEQIVDDWLVQCNYHAEMRKVIDDCARLGTGVLKGPTPVKRKQRKVSHKAGVLEFIQVDTIDPASKHIAPDRCYPDPNCGDDIQNGEYFFEQDSLSARRLRDLKGLPGYLSDQIDLCIEEGPQRRNTKAGMGKPTDDSDMFDVWYGYCELDADDMAMLGCKCKTESAFAIVTLVNDRPVKAALNPLDSGAYPYSFMPWQATADRPWGHGVPWQIRTPQRMITSANRNMMDNAGLSGGPILVIRDKILVPTPGDDMVLRPRKVLLVREDADIAKVEDAIKAIQIPSMQVELLNIIQFALKMAEDVTGMPAILQGQLGKAPDTVGGMQMLQNNASSVMRRVAKLFDDKITRPHMRRYYEWLMLYSDKEEAKGDYLIDARGSSTLVERDLQQQSILQMGALVMNPAFELSPSKWIQETLKSQKLDPKRFTLDDEEKARMAQQQPAPPPQVIAAQIRAQAQLEAKKIDAAVTEKRIAVEVDRDTVYVQSQTERDRAEFEQSHRELLLKRELALLEYANQQKISLEQIKKDLTIESARLNTQKELAGADHAMQVATAAVEPPGRAPNGKAFEA